MTPRESYSSSTDLSQLVNITIYDDPSTLHSKLAAIIEELLLRGRKLTDFYEINEPCAEKNARKHWSLVEKELYDMWKNGAKLPKCNWDTDVVRLYTISRSMNERAAALRELYQDETISPENAHFFHTTYEELVPLVNARMRVIRARRDMTSGLQSLSHHEFVELRILNHILSLSSQAMQNNYVPVSKSITKDIHYFKDILVKRRQGLLVKARSGTPTLQTGFCGQVRSLLKIEPEEQPSPKKQKRE
jgi:hypothetical protein